MKKLATVMLVVVTVLSVSCAFADDSEKMTFEDVTFGKAYKIKGYASVTLLGFKFVDMYAQWEDGKAGKSGNDVYYYGTDAERGYIYVYTKKTNDPHERGVVYKNCSFIKSENEADYAWLKVDITNLQKVDAAFMKEAKIKVIYDDEYEYDGWVRQFNYDYSKTEVFSSNKEAGTIGWPVCLSPVDEMPIKQMYKGHYAFGCTLPNSVVEDKSAPLRMIITINGHEFTYNIRK